MSLPWNVNASMGGAGVNYQIQRSLRFRSSATAYLNKTFSSSGTDLRKWTLSFWMKRGALSVQSVPFSCQDTPGTGASSVYFLIGSGNTIGVFYPNTGANLNVGTAAVLRDPSAWYHVLFAFDTTQATSTDRIKIYINGVQQTLSGGGTYPTLNSTTTWNSNCPHFISKNPVASSDYFDGYFAEIYNIDGQALTPASFGYNDPVTGVWQPAPFKGTYGTNGFYLPFTDIATTSGSNFGLGRDYSGNGNYFNTNNISVTTGSTYDSMIDSPTNFSDGSTYYNRGNYATWNALQTKSTLSQANLLSAGGGGAGTFYSTASTISIATGKWYWEITCVANTDGLTGIVETTQMIDVIKNTNYVGQTSLGYGYHANGNKYNNATSSAYGATYTTGDVIGVAFDADARTLAYYKNGVSQGTAFTVTSGYTWLPADSVYVSDSKAVNFGQRPFTYTPPTGYKALNTFNLPLPTIANGAAYMAATLYTGNGSTNNIVNSQNNGGNNALGKSFYADFAWAKARSVVQSHFLANSVTGTNKYLQSDTTGAEISLANSFTSFNSDGFTLGSSGAANGNTYTYVAWQWLAGAGTTSTNTSGSITSTVSVNTTAGFSIVTYTGTGAVGTIGHGLGVAPSMMIVKRRSTTGNWPVYHISVGNNQGCFLNLTNAVNSQPNFWNSTTPTSSVFTVGTDTETNQVSQTLVAYCFAAVRGYSAFGSYTGNGSTDGPFVYTGFRPRFIIAKNATTGGAAYDWDMVDTSRNPYNPGSQLADLAANLSRAEQTIGGTNLDILSNGFKMRSTDGVMNGNGNTIIYAAFAENPFNYSRAR